MTQIGNVTEIKKIKKKLTALQNKRLIEKWELPYENLLTRLTAAIFFLSVAENTDLEKIWSELEKIPGFKYRENRERNLSRLEWRIEFNNEEV